MRRGWPTKTGKETPRGENNESRGDDEHSINNMGGHNYVVSWLIMWRDRDDGSQEPEESGIAVCGDDRSSSSSLYLFWQGVFLFSLRSLFAICVRSFASAETALDPIAALPPTTDKVPLPLPPLPPPLIRPSALP